MGCHFCRSVLINKFPTPSLLEVSFQVEMTQFQDLKLSSPNTKKLGERESVKLRVFFMSVFKFLGTDGMRKVKVLTKFFQEELLRKKHEI
jgi:hypothetical protein|mmetsp:Transcript_6884/g.7516  ORF Transcript_6884/g.7516 Transcript_6884/m.7516 type:complete len:90 (+) Transcript_6884:3639-3908(+)